MTQNFIPVEVICNNRKRIWHMDASRLSTIELMKLKESLKNTTFSPTISMLDKLIYTSTNSFCGLRGNMYMKEMKRNYKIKTKKQKIRSEYNDKHKR